MKSFSQYINESLNKPYEYKKDMEDRNDHYYSFNDKNGKKTHVYITHYKAKNGDTHASVDFTDEKGDIQATGKGGIRHISTVKRIMDDHAKNHPNLKMYTFTGEKDTDKPGEGGRNRLYARLAKQAGGHTEDISAYSNRHYVPVNQNK